MAHRLFYRVFRLIFVLVMLAQVTQPASAAMQAEVYQLTFPILLIRNVSYYTELQLYNQGSSVAEVAVDVMSPNGSASLNRTIPPGGTLLVTEDNFPSLTGGNVPYTAVVSSSQPLDGVVAYYKKTGSLISLYRGMRPPSSSGIYHLFFGPFYKNSFLTLTNVSTNSEAMVDISFYTVSGVLQYAHQATIPMMSTMTYTPTSSITVGTYLAVVSSSQPLVGLAQNMEIRPDGSQIRLIMPLQTGNSALNARALKSVDDYGGVRTSRFFTANLGTAPGSFTRTLFSQIGSVSSSTSFNLNTLGFRIEDLAQLSLPDNNTNAMVTTGAPDVAVGDMTEFVSLPANISFASYEAGTGIILPLPRLVKAPHRDSIISIYNTAASPAIVTLTIYPQNGAPFTQNFNLNANGSTRYDLKNNSQLPESFTGGGMISANQPVNVVVDEFYTYVPPCTTPAVTLSHTPSGTLYPTTMIEWSAAATGDAPLSYSWSLDGSAVGSDSPTYSTTLPSGNHNMQVTVTNSCGTDSASETVIVSPPACTAPDVTLTHTPTGTLYPTSSIHFDAAATGSAPIDYAWTVDGLSVGTNNAVFDTTLPIGSHDVQVTASNGCGSDSALNSIFISPLPCTQPTMTLAQSPMGVIYPDDMLHFSTAVSGTAPLTYTWTIDGSSAGIDAPTLDTTLPAGNHYVTATVSNSCGTYSYTRAFTVVQPALPQADLTQSTLKASTASASMGDRLKFIAVLRNTGALSALDTRFTNLIPGYTQYVEGSAKSTDGKPVVFDNVSLSWRGDLVPGSPVVITYEVTVTGTPVERMIDNTAHLRDKDSNLLATLNDSVRYRPGYSLKINNGAVGTSSLKVDLSFSYNPDDNPLFYQISNNAAFDAQGSATGWLALNPLLKTHPGWDLDPLGDPRLPRTVYIRFKKAAGDTLYIGPFMASIIYDPQPPADPQVDLAGAQVLAASSLSGAQWNVTTSDDNSGVDLIQISMSPDFNSRVSEIPATGQLTTYTWLPYMPGTIYIRAVDRSGNVSKTVMVGTDAFHFVFLPSLRK